MSNNRRLDQINQRANDLGLPKQYFQKLYFIERFLDNISNSSYKDDFILKGGFELQSLLGVTHRMTEDLDTTLNRHDLNPDNVIKVLTDICLVSQNSDVQFSIRSLKPEMDENRYPGLRATIAVKMGEVKNSFKLDISTGDLIIPEPIKLNYHGSLNDTKPFQVWAFPPTQIIADKLTALVKFGRINSRAKDLFDFYALKNSDFGKVNALDLLEAYQGKSQNIGLTTAISDIPKQVELLRSSVGLQKSWTNYQRRRPYASEISFDDTLSAAASYANMLDIANKKVVSNQKK